MKKVVYLALVLTLFIGSCKKTETITPVDLSGTVWVGTANVPGIALTNKPFSLTFNADGTLTGYLNNGSNFPIAGSWNLTPSSSIVRLFFTLQTVPGSYVGQATLADNNTKLDGGIGTNANSPTHNLNFVVTKQ